MKQDLKYRIDVARGLTKADLVSGAGGLSSNRILFYYLHSFPKNPVTLSAGIEGT